MHCRRCHGLMVRDRFFDSDEEGGLLTFWGWRCICCGEIIDPVILANRANPPVPRKRQPRFPRPVLAVVKIPMELVEMR